MLVKQYSPSTFPARPDPHAPGAPQCSYGMLVGTKQNQKILRPREDDGSNGHGISMVAEGVGPANGKIYESEILLGKSKAPPGDGDGGEDGDGAGDGRGSKLERARDELWLEAAAAVSGKHAPPPPPLSGGRGRGASGAQAVLLSSDPDTSPGGGDGRVCGGGGGGGVRRALLLARVLAARSCKECAELQAQLRPTSGSGGGGGGGSGGGGSEAKVGPISVSNEVGACDVLSESLHRHLQQLR